VQPVALAGITKQVQRLFVDLGQAQLVRVLVLIHHHVQVQVSGESRVRECVVVAYGVVETDFHLLVLQLHNWPQTAAVMKIVDLDWCVLKKEMVMEQIVASQSKEIVPVLRTILKRSNVSIRLLIQVCLVQREAVQIQIFVQIPLMLPL
jgi:hypothetical protein